MDKIRSILPKKSSIVEISQLWCPCSLSTAYLVSIRYSKVPFTSLFQKRAFVVKSLEITFITFIVISTNAKYRFPWKVLLTWGPNFMIESLYFKQMLGTYLGFSTELDPLSLNLSPSGDEVLISLIFRPFSKSFDKFLLGWLKNFEELIHGASLISLILVDALSTSWIFICVSADNLSVRTSWHAMDLEASIMGDLLDTLESFVFLSLTTLSKLFLFSVISANNSFS